MNLIVAMGFGMPIMSRSNYRVFYVFH